MKAPAETHRATARVRRECPLPFVLINMAMTADGKIASANHKVSSFGSARDHDHLLELRSTADAVMAGARTVDLNSVNLGPGPLRFRRRRLKMGLAEFNLRVVVSGSGSLDPEAEIFRHRFSPVIVLVSERASRTRLGRLRSLADVVKVCGRTQVDLRRALRWLGEEWGVRRLLCEGGGELNAALWGAGLVDELHLTVCPMIFGGRTAPTIAGGVGARSLAGAVTLELRSAVRRAREMFLVYSVRKARPGRAQPH
jgi:riboflavin-specific deaminase-like protein